MEQNIVLSWGLSTFLGLHSDWLGIFDLLGSIDCEEIVAKQARALRFPGEDLTKE